MIRRDGVTICLVLLLGTLLLGSTGAWADDAKMEGTWFCQVSWAGGIGLAYTEMLLTADSRGNVRTSDSDDMIGLNPVLGAPPATVQTAGAGGWKKVRGAAFVLNYLQFGFTGNGANAGLLSNLARFRCAVKLRRNVMKGACDADLWFAADGDGDGLPNVPNPVTTAPDWVIPEIEEIDCNRIPVVPRD